MVEATKSAAREIMENPSSGRAEYFKARSLAYSSPEEMKELIQCVTEAQEKCAATHGPEHAHIALCAGVGLWIQRRYSEAVQILESVADNATAAYFLALCETELGQTDKALASLKKGAKQDAFACAMAEAEALRRAGCVADAMECVKTFQKSHDAEAELHYQKGRVLDAGNEFEPAMAAFERAVELDPNHAGALFRLGYWNDLRGNDDLALEYYEKAAAVRPVHENVLVNLGIMYEDRGENEKAARLYERLLAVDPTAPRPRLYYKDAVASLNMFYDEALERRANRTAVLLRTPLSEFELSARCRSCLEKMNVRTLGDLAHLSEMDISGSKNFGETSLTELRELLESKGLHFGMGRSDEAGVAVAELTEPAAPGDVLTKTVADLDLSIRAQKCMRALMVETIGDLVQKSEKDLLGCPNFGQTSLNEIKRKLESFGLALKAKEE